MKFLLVMLTPLLLFGTPAWSQQDQACTVSDVVTMNRVLERLESIESQLGQVRGDVYNMQRTIAGLPAQPIFSSAAQPVASSNAVIVQPGASIGSTSQTESFEIRDEDYRTYDVQRLTEVRQAVNVSRRTTYDTMINDPSGSTTVVCAETGEIRQIIIDDAQGENRILMNPTITTPASTDAGQPLPVTSSSASVRMVRRFNAIDSSGRNVWVSENPVTRAVVIQPSTTSVTTMQPLPANTAVIIGQPMPNAVASFQPQILDTVGLPGQPQTGIASLATPDFFARMNLFIEKLESNKSWIWAGGGDASWWHSFYNQNKTQFLHISRGTFDDAESARAECRRAFFPAETRSAYTRPDQLAPNGSGRTVLSKLGPFVGECLASGTALASRTLYDNPPPYHFLAYAESFEFFESSENF